VINVNVIHAENIRRNLKKMHRLLTPGDDRDGQLIDLVNHIDTLAQQIERTPPTEGGAK